MISKFFKNNADTLILITFISIVFFVVFLFLGKDYTIKVIFLFLGVLLPYVLDYRKNHVYEDLYFKTNIKVLKRKIILDFVLAGIAFIAIHGTKSLEHINIVGTILIGSNGISVVEKTFISQTNTDENIED